MKKFSCVKRAFALMIVLVLMISASAIGVHALNGPASGLSWSGMWALWNQPDPSEGEVQGYYVRLFKNKSYIDDYYAYSTSYNLSSPIEINGVGWYTFSITVDYGDAKSSSVQSPIFQYEGESGHTHIMTYYSFSYPTCTEKGCKGYYVCNDCGKWYWDENGDNEITDTDEAFTDPIGHDWGDWVVTKKPTTTSEGEAKRVCNNDPDHVQTTAIPKLKDENEQIVLPTEKGEKATEKATKETESATEKASEKATVAATLNKNDGSGNLLSKLFGNTTLLLIVAASVIGGLLLIGGVIVLIVVLKKRRKNTQQPIDPQNKQ